MADIIDMAQAREELNLANALRAQANRAAAAREASAARSDDAICPDCGDAIPGARLMVMPDALRCADCQGAHEQLGRP